MVTHKYQQLERELVDGRLRKKLLICEFMEENVGGHWSKLRNGRLKIEAVVKSRHQVGPVILNTSKCLFTNLFR